MRGVGDLDRDEGAFLRDAVRGGAYGPGDVRAVAGVVDVVLGSPQGVESQDRTAAKVNVAYVDAAIEDVRVVASTCGSVVDIFSGS